MTNLNQSNKYLLIDCGNSYLKMAIYINNKLIDFVQIPVNKNVKDGLKQFKNIKDINKVFVLATGKYQNHLKSLTTIFKNASFKIVNVDDFKQLLDLSNIDKNVVIGNDIMLLNYWASKQKNVKAVVCLGSVYFALIANKTKFISVILLPSLVKGLNQIAQVSCIPNNLIPKSFNKTKGLNTPDAFASGVNLALCGFINQILKTYKLNKEQIVITGGDANKYASIKSFKIIDQLTIKALALLIKEKQW